jgi:Flp pilus assembly protein TadG
MTRTSRHSSKRSLRQSSALTRLYTSDRGNVTVLLGFAMGIMIMSAGAAIDIGRHSMAKEELATAVDTAALAACRAWQLSNTTAGATTVKTAQTNEAQKYISANFNNARYGANDPTVNVSFPVVPAANSQSGQFTDQIKVKVTASTYVPTTLLKVVGTKELPISATSECARAQGGIELTMVLDTTGSMGSSLGGSSKISALRNATAKMLDLLYGASDSSPLVRVNIIPYAVSVNVGRLLNAADIESDTNEPGYTQANMESFSATSPPSSDVDNNKWYGCITERETNNTIGLDGSGNALTPDKTLDVPWDAFDMADVPANTTVTSSGGVTKQTGKWKPFIQKYNEGSTRPTHSMYNLNALNNYVLGTGNGSSGNASKNRGYCSAPAVMYTQGLTHAQLKSLVLNTNYMIPDGNTYSDVGMAWAVRMMSPGEPFPSPVQYADRYSTDNSNQYAGWVKGILMMTDGVINASTPLERSDQLSLMTAYGFNQRAVTGGTMVKEYNQLLPTSGSNNTIDNLNNNIHDKLNTAHEQRLLMACKQARKPLGWDVAANPDRENDAIRVYTVFFASASELAAKAQLYKDCAGKDGFFINAQNETELNSAFSQIASDLQNLRLSL